MSLKIEWSTQLRKIKELTPFPHNPRKMSKEQAKNLLDSLEKFDYVELVAINTDNVILAGHMRIQAMQKMGWGKKDIEVRVPNRLLTKEESEEYLIRSNKNTGTWDFDVLAAWQHDLLKECGFTTDELCEIYDIEEVVTADPDDEVLEPPKNPITKLGDIYVLGEHRLICGDSTNPDTVAALLEGAEPILMVTDPPYNMAEKNDIYAKNVSKSMKKLKDANWDRNFNPLLFLQCFEKFMPKNISLYVFASHHTAPLIWTWMENFCNHHSWCVWEKPNPMPSLSKRHWTWNGELICYGTIGKHIFNFPENGHALSIWKINKENPTCDHPTQKPVEAMSKPIIASSNKKDVVYDPFLGSGTTLLAAEQLGRKCFGIELDPAYCDIIVERWKKYREKLGKDSNVQKTSLTT